MAEERVVEILGGEPGDPGRYLSRVFDPATGQYFAPTLAGDPSHIEEAHREGFDGRGATVAVVDTGMLLDHPWIKRVLVESVDMTGEGPGDENGHGTAVTLIELLVAPSTRIVNVKVMGRDGRGGQKQLAEGIGAAAKRGVDVINISAGVLHKRWWFLDCRGDCLVCTAAGRAAAAGAIVCAAAGNTPGETYCPATRAQTHGDVMSIAAYDLDGIAPYSGRGDFGGPIFVHEFVPV